MSPRKFSSPALALLVVCLLATWATSAMAAQDFATDSAEWNGLQEFVDLAGDLGIELVEVDMLDWREVRAEDIIVIIYPTQTLDVESLADFMIAGGRVVIADDFGSSEPFLERLSLRRTQPAPEELGHRNFVDDHRGWPVFSPTGRHPLLEDVSALVGNYPAVLHNVGGPVVIYDDGDGFVYDMMLGAGRAVVVADPSLFINAMLPAADNRQFVENIWNYLCADELGCRAWLLIDDFQSRGYFREQDSSFVRGEDVRHRVQSLNERLRDVFSRLPETELLYFLAIFLVLGTAAYLVTVFPWHRSTHLSTFIDRHRQELSPPLTEFDWNVARFSDSSGRINYVLPMAVLKESFEDVFFKDAGLSNSDDDQRPGIEILVQHFRDRYLRQLPEKKRDLRSEELRGLLEELEEIPSRHRVFLDSEQYFGRRDLQRMHRKIVRILSWMGLQESYERRTRKINARTSGERR